MHVERYRACCPAKRMYSLSQNPAAQPQTESKDGYWPTLTTNSQLWTLTSTGRNKLFCACHHVCVFS